MAIKQTQILTRQEFDQAMVHLRLNISEVSRATGIPRTYLSEFRNGDRQLRPENLAKLKDLFESKGLEFEAEPEATHTQATQIDPQSDPEGMQRAILAVRHLAIDPGITRKQAEAILEKIAANDREAKDMLQARAERGMFSDWSDDTNDMLKGVFGLFAENYVLLRMLQGRHLVVLADRIEHDNVETVANIFANLFYEGNAGQMFTSESNETTEKDEDEE